MPLIGILPSDHILICTIVPGADGQDSIIVPFPYIDLILLDTEFVYVITLVVPRVYGYTPLRRCGTLQQPHIS
jgi:hypothetical protein